MTEAVWIALISNATTIIVVVLSRWLSSREHRETKQEVNQIKEALNGAVGEHRSPGEE